MGEQAVTSLHESRTAKLRITVRADHERMWRAASDLGLREHVENDPPLDDDDPSWGATAAVVYEDARKPESQLNAVDLFRLVAALGDGCDVWVGMDCPGVRVEAHVGARAATVVLDHGEIDGEHGERIQRAIDVLSGAGR